MLSIFPDLLNYQFLGVFLIRISLGLVLAYLGLMTIGVKKKNYEIGLRVHNFPLTKFIPAAVGYMEIICGLFILFGFLTQIMVLISIYIFINLIFLEKYVAKVFNYPYIFYMTMILLSIAIVFTGPGIFAIDYPF